MVLGPEAYVDTLWHPAVLYSCNANRERNFIQAAAGSLQLCAGQISGSEAAVHSMQSAIFRHARLT